MLALAIGFVFYGHLCTMHFVQEQQQQKTFNFLKRTLTTLGAAILFCLVAMQRSVSDSESAPNTVTKRHKALFGNIPLHYEALSNALLMQLIPAHSNIFSQKSQSIILWAYVMKHIKRYMAITICMGNQEFISK